MEIRKGYFYSAILATAVAGSAITLSFWAGRPVSADIQQTQSLSSKTSSLIADKGIVEVLGDIYVHIENPEQKEAMKGRLIRLYSELNSSLSSLPKEQQF